jgi:outer membrane protein assembly factor BamB
LRISPRTLVVVLVGASALAAGSLPASAVAGSAAGATNAGWSQTNGDAAQSRANHHESVLTTRTVHGLAYRRSIVARPTSLANGCETPGIATPVLTDGHVVAVVNGRLSTYTASTGRQVWSSQLDASDTTTYSFVSVADGVVVVGGEDCESQSDPNGVEQAYNAQTGAHLWTQPTTPDGGALSRLVVSGRYVVATGDSLGSGQMTSVRKLATGAVVWFQTTGSCESFASTNVVVVDGKVVYSHCNQDGEDPVLEADGLVSGAVAWTRSGTWSVEQGDTDALTSRHLIAIGPAGVLNDLAPATGQTRHHFLDANQSLVVGTARLYTTCGTGSVCAYKLSNGTQMWSVTDASTLGAEAAGLLYLSDGSVRDTRTGVVVRRIGNGDGTSALEEGNGRVAMIDGPRVLDLYGLAGS